LDPLAVVVEQLQLQAQAFFPSILVAAVYQHLLPRQHQLLHLHQLLLSRQRLPQLLEDFRWTSWQLLQLWALSWVKLLVEPSINNICLIYR
jgi:hypothetical protein